MTTTSKTTNGPKTAAKRTTAKPTAKKAAAKPAAAPLIEETAPAPAATLVEPVEAMEEQFEETVKAGTEAAASNLEASMELTKKGVEDAVKGYDRFAEFNKDNMDAVVAAGNAVAKGAETLQDELMAYAKRNLEDSTAAFKALSGAKNAKEFFDIQTSLVKSHYDGLVGEISKMSELSLRISNEVMEPLNARMAVAMDKLSQPMNR